MQESFKIKAENLESSLIELVSKGMTEFTLQDSSILNNKQKLLQFLRFVEKECPELFLTLPLSAQMLDMDICRECCEVNCSIDIPFAGSSKGETYLFDKKFYSKRAQTLNTLGLVFGFQLDFAKDTGDSVKLFRERLNLAVSLYPNHIDFPQIDDAASSLVIKPTALFSSQDIKMTKETAFACQVFYSWGRAVPWFLSVLKPLKMSCDKFFKDFAEWQNHNNCSLDSGWNIDKANHKEIEKMQLAFLKFKYEEKHVQELFDVVSNVIRLNGAFARCYGEGEESSVDLSYNPDELLGGGAFDIQSFFDNSFMEKSRVKVYLEGEEAQYRYI